MARVSLEAVQKLVKTWQAHLQLEDWEISVELLPTTLLEDDNCASIEVPAEDEHSAILRLPEFCCWRTARRRVIHELLHLLFRRLDEPEPILLELMGAGPREEWIIHVLEPLLSGYARNRR